MFVYQKLKSQFAISNVIVCDVHYINTSQNKQSEIVLENRNLLYYLHLLISHFKNYIPPNSIQNVVTYLTLYYFLSTYVVDKAQGSWTRKVFPMTCI